MKFARGYKEALEREEYPPQWIESAISYKKLKKCIKKVQSELLSLGLDHATLERLWQHGSIGSPFTDVANSGYSMSYALSENDIVGFTPKLTIALDPDDGSPIDAWLSPETRQFLRRHGRRTSSATLGRDSAAEDAHPQLNANGEHHREDTTPDGGESLEPQSGVETIEIPLTSDSEFFQILRRELANLEHIREAEQKHLESEITQLGDELKLLNVSTKRKKQKRSNEEVEAWREIFRLYHEAEVFFSSHEVDAGRRDSAHAQNQLTLFTDKLASEKGKKLILSQEAADALERFLRINFDLLKLMKYQEINQTALSKIMKKFDKQTTLHAREGVLQQINKSPFMARDLAKATCYIISDELLKIIPQLDDYLCPVCFSISWRPIRLRCGHVFCIRCLIVMQRAEKDECPLCRGHVVMEATSDNVDHALVKFLKENFKDEVKAKQRENEHAAGVDQFGESYTGTHKCAVM